SPMLAPPSAGRRKVLRELRGRPAAAPLSHELVDLGLVLGVPQPLQEALELVDLLLEPPQGCLPIFVEGTITGRLERADATSPTHHLTPELAVFPLAFPSSASHASTPDQIGQNAKADGPPQNEAYDHGCDPCRLPVLV